MEDPDLHSQESAITALQAANDHDLRVACYCEENVWRLAFRKMRQQPEDQYFVVFISNSIKNVPMFHQHASTDPQQACCWDYHVILLCARASHHDVVVYDIDSVLPYPSPLENYLAESFPYEWPYPFAPMFRLIPALVFLRFFASDRMHMFNAQTRQWNATPPTYDCINIRGGRTSSNMQRYINFREHHSPKKKKTEEMMSDGGDDNDEAVYGSILSLQELQNYPGFFTEEPTAA